MSDAPKVTAIDRDRLYSDLGYRFDYVSKFVGFDETDSNAIKGAAHLIAPLVPDIVDAVYERLFSFDITKKVFVERGEGFHGLTSSMNSLNVDDDQIKFRKDFLAKYFVKLVTAEYDAKFVLYLHRVGKMHTTTPDKTSKINVEYIHINALFGWLHGFLAETIDKLPELQNKVMAPKRAKLLAAFSKILWIQNDFFSMFYMRDTEKITTINRDRLYTDLMYRFEYVSKFVDFNESDIKAIKDSAPLIAPLVPTIVDAVYDRLFSFDITKNVFMERGDGFHGRTAATATALTVNDEQIKFRKDFLAKYLVKLVSAEYDAKFVAYLDRVGRIHTDTPDKKSKINVEYIHCNALFGWLHGFLAETIDNLPQLQGKDVAAKRAKTLAAFSKLLWIQNDFFSMYYLRESEVFRGNKQAKSLAKTSMLNHVGIANGTGVATLVAVVAISVFATLKFSSA
ncbi:hypothetical protein HDU98_008620 [Podochytrium sp. JEL0797]|nr:hypothetical protein HDU98_008620 [Podochytrium sp. JEL0797]